MYECELAIGEEEYRRKFSGDDVETSFVYMLNRLEDLWNNVKFEKFKNVCERDRRLSDEIRNNLEPANTLGKMFNVLSKSPFCNWLEIRILKCMAEVANIPEAIMMLKIFEECVYKRKCSEVETHFVKQFINPDHLALVIAKLNENPKHTIVADLIKYRQKVESVLHLPPESTTLVRSNTGCLEVSMVFPCDSCILAHETAKSCFFKLRTFNIQYLQIGAFPKVYATNVANTVEAEALLAELSSHNNCKLNIALV